jgi:hypothetical protein
MFDAPEPNTCAAMLLVAKRCLDSQAGRRRFEPGLPDVPPDPSNIVTDFMRERAEAIGAELDVWSSNGLGTEVDLRVPASVAYETCPARRLSWFHKNGRETNKPIRVLVVDDHPLFRERIAAILEAQPDMSLAPRFKSFEHIVRMWF